MWFLCMWFLPFFRVQPHNHPTTMKMPTVPCKLLFIWYQLHWKLFDDNCSSKATSFLPSHHITTKCDMSLPFGRQPLVFSVKHDSVMTASYSHNTVTLTLTQAQQSSPTNSKDTQTSPPSPPHDQEQYVSNIGFITVHGLNEGHIAPYSDIEFQLTKYVCKQTLLWNPKTNLYNWYLKKLYDQEQ